MTSVADEGHLDPLAETSQGRSRQELRCLCKQIFLCVFTSSCFCLCVCVVQSRVHPSVHNNVGVSVARLCIGW